MIAKDETPLDHLRRLEKVTAGNPDHPEAHKALGEAALAARLWGEARRHLLAALQSHPTQGVYRLLAKLEEAEFANHAAAHEWLGKAAHAAPDPGWACTVCGAPALEWTLTCPSCGAIDSFGLGRVAHAACGGRIAAAASRLRRLGAFTESVSRNLHGHDVVVEDLATKILSRGTGRHHQ